MSKYLIMCEGPNELEIMRILLAHDLLIYRADDLLDMIPYHARQITGNAQVRAALNSYFENDVVVLRVGDKLNDRLVIPQEYREKITDVRKYCTKPELEMLLIIAEDLISEYEKTKSSVGPKAFAKNHVIYGKHRYDNSTAFYRNYFGNRSQLLLDAIKEYKRIKPTHKKDEDYLASLLKPAP